MSIWQINLATLKKEEHYRKRKAERYLQDKAYFEPTHKTPKEGFVLEPSVVDEGIVFYYDYEKEYFNSRKKPRVVKPIEQDTPIESARKAAVEKAGLLVDKINGIKRLKDPHRWCILPKSESVTIEIPLTEYENNAYGKEVVQEIGRVAWHKAYFHVDKRVYEPEEKTVNIRQVLNKVEAVRLPRWKRKDGSNRPWNLKFIGAIEVPGTVFCTEKEVLKKRKFIKGTKPDIVHQRDVSHETRGTGCSVFRRHQPPVWTYHRQPDEEENDKIWNGLEDRNQWVFSSLYHIWAGEERQPGDDWRERVYWTGPARHYQRNKYLECHFPPHCVVVEDEVEPEDIEVDEDSTAW